MNTGMDCFRAPQRTAPQRSGVDHALVPPGRIVAAPLRHRKIDVHVIDRDVLNRVFDVCP